MAKAKIASKNNPDTRGQKARDYYFNNRQVEAVLCIIDGRKLRAASYIDDGKMVVDKLGNIIAWKLVSSSSSNAAPAA